MADGGRQWRIISLPAIAEEDDALGLEPGEALWPERFPVPLLDDARLESGEREWAALYQQRPRPPEGSLFKVHQIAEMPAGQQQCVQVVRSWDLAMTEQIGTRDPDWTVGLKLGRMASGGFVVLDIVRFRGGPDEVEAAILTLVDGGENPRINGEH
jgi:hypothetical protein